MDAPEAPEKADSSRLGAYYELTKPGIAGYVMCTAGASAFVASQGNLALDLAIHTMASTGLATAGALSLNQYIERDVDARMHRTRGRPLPTERLTPNEALAFGSVALMGGLVYMAVMVGLLPALLTAASGLMYHGVYTPLKSRSYVATLAGAECLIERPAHQAALAAGENVRIVPLDAVAGF